MSPVHFALVILEMEVSQTSFPGWPQTTIPLISASHIPRITAMSHQYPALLDKFLSMEFLTARILT
jgi:hypothetical protein